MLPFNVFIFKLLTKNWLCQENREKCENLNPCLRKVYKVCCGRFYSRCKTLRISPITGYLSTQWPKSFHNYGQFGFTTYSNMFLCCGRKPTQAQGKHTTQHNQQFSLRCFCPHPKLKQVNKWNFLKKVWTKLAVSAIGVNFPKYITYTKIKQFWNY